MHIINICSLFIVYTLYSSFLAFHNCHVIRVIICCHIESLENHSFNTNIPMYCLIILYNLAKNLFVEIYSFHRGLLGLSLGWVESGLVLTRNRLDWIGWMENGPVADRSSGRTRWHGSSVERVGSIGLFRVWIEAQDEDRNKNPKNKKKSKPREQRNYNPNNINQDQKHLIHETETKNRDNTTHTTTTITPSPTITTSITSLV